MKEIVDCPINSVQYKNVYCTKIDEYYHSGVYYIEMFLTEFTVNNTTRMKKYTYKKLMFLTLLTTSNCGVYFEFYESLVIISSAIL